MLVREWRQATRYLPERLAMTLVRVEAGHTVPTREAGYDVDQSGGSPHGTTREAGYDVGRPPL